MEEEKGKIRKTGKESKKTGLRKAPKVQRAEKVCGGGYEVYRVQEAYEE